MPPWPLPVVALGAALLLMTLVWVGSVFGRDASIVDIFWSLGFVLVAWVYRLGLSEHSVRGSLVVGLVTLWGVRLALHIFWRGRGRGEDYRYREMRERRPGSFAAWSLVVVFWLQAVLLWLVSMPLYQSQRQLEPAALGLLDGLGLALFLIGFTFEAGGDWQLDRFRRDPANQGQVMDRGLWRYTRHPNYFGDAVVWWSFFCFAAATLGGWWTVFSPVLMTVLLLRVSGVTLLERRLRETRPGYRSYALRTNAFFPWLPSPTRTSESDR